MHKRVSREELNGASRNIFPIALKRIVFNLPVRIEAMTAVDVVDPLLDFGWTGHSDLD